MPSSPHYVPFVDLHALHRGLSTELDHAWRSVLLGSTFIGGAHLERFEEDWATYCGTRHAVGVSSGTDALRLALHALGIGNGDEVIVPANTFVGTAEAVVAVGAEPRFVDVDAETLLVTAEGVESALTPRTAAVIVVHLYGQMPDMEALAAVAERAGVALLEDAAQAHGARWNGRRAGSWGRAGCFSFYPAKNLGALGDAGAVVTDDPSLAATVRSLADHGRPAGNHDRHELVGGTNRLDALQAAVLCAKLPHLGLWNDARRRAAAHYAALMAHSPARLVATHPRAESAYHLQVVRIEDRDETRRALRKLGIQTAVHYPLPLHRLPPYSRYHDRPLPMVEEAARTVVSLPLFPQISEAQIGRVVDALLRAMQHGASYV